MHTKAICIVLGAMAANLKPGDEAIYPEANALMKSMMDSMPAAAKETSGGKRELKVTQMVQDEPHIDPSALEAIAAHACAGERSRCDSRRAHPRDLPPHPEQPALHISERDTHGSLRCSGSLQHDRRTLLSPAVCEKGPHPAPPHIV